MKERIHAFLSRWTTAERTGDGDTLAALLTDDFCGVGPLGFVLSRTAWLERHHQGLAYEQFNLEEIRIRLYGDVAVVTGRNNARGTYQGQPLPGPLRATLVIAPNSEGVQLGAVHMSFIAGTQGSLPMPGPANAVESSAATGADREER